MRQQDIGNWNDTINQSDFTDIYRILYPKQENTHSFQVYMEQSPEETLCHLTK